MLNALFAEADRQICGVKLSIKLVSASVSLIHLQGMSIEATLYGFPSFIINNLCLFLSACRSASKLFLYTF